MLRYSLVLATIGRTTELTRFLVHLRRQECPNVELIVVDQNSDTRLVDILLPFQDDFKIVHIRTNIRGLSRARNLGLEKVSHEIVAFPDDDCWYPDGTLNGVTARFSECPTLAGVTGRLRDEERRGAYSWMDKVEGKVTRSNVWRRCNSNTIFLQRQVIERVGGFDESLGVGCDTGRIAAEEVDYLIRALDLDFSIFFDPRVQIDHRDVPLVCSDDVLSRSYGYSLGVGHVLRKHNYPLVRVLGFLARPIGAFVLYGLRGDVRRSMYHFLAARGRLQGWLGTP